jgi:DNA-binding Lrp family transcriptional regulator
MSDDTGASPSERHTTGEDRVRMIARQLRKPRTANWIAEEAGWSHEPTKRVLERLADDGVVRRDDAGAHTTYSPDYRQQAIREAIRLRDGDLTADELAAKVSAMKADIREWEASFDVESADELRASVADADLDADEEAHRREVARDWERLERRIAIARFALREWEFLGADPSTSAAEP